MFLETRTLSQELGPLLMAFQMGSGLALGLDWFRSGTSESSIHSALPCNFEQDSFCSQLCSEDQWFKENTSYWQEEACHWLMLE